MPDRDDRAIESVSGYRRGPVLRQFYRISRVLPPSETDVAPLMVTPFPKQSVLQLAVRVADIKRGGKSAEEKAEAIGTIVRTFSLGNREVARRHGIRTLISSRTNRSFTDLKRSVGATGMNTFSVKLNSF